jgi:hypothetical protein
MILEIFLLYIWTRLDALSLVVTVAAFVLGLLSGLLCLAICVNIADMGDLPESKKKAEKSLSRTIRWFVLMLACYVLMPSKQDAAIILAGTGVLAAAQTDTAKHLASKSVKVIEKAMDDYLKEKEAK